MTITEIGEKAVKACRILRLADTETKNAALEKIAAALTGGSEEIVAANAVDMENGEKAGLSRALLDRLFLDRARIEGIAEGVLSVASLPDPVGRVLSEAVRPNGLRIEKISVPIGVIAVIYEARPNVTADSAALCLKSGNAVILRGGKEAINSNMAIARIMRSALPSAGLPEDCIQLVEDTSRDSANQLMRANGLVDVLIPRGGQSLIRSVIENSTVPVIETGAGTCHVYVDRTADIDMAAQIIFNAKTSRPSVCNACECMLIHNQIAGAALPVIKAMLDEKNVEIRGDETVFSILPGIRRAEQSDWGREFNDYIIAARTVDSVEEAIEHIYNYGTGHSECIVTEDKASAEKFLSSIDAAAVYHNASTRFTDGSEFGFGAEIGISTQKLHARGPLGLPELTSFKYRIYGNGQVR